VDNALPQEIMTRWRKPIDEELDIQEALRTLWRHKVLLFGSIVTLTVLSIVAVSLMTPLYTAEALVVVENRNTELTDINTVISGLSVNTNVIQTEVVETTYF
jgi:succinoglycan biosynthesis transport protein ExoP